MTTTVDDIVSSRTFAASRERLFDAFADPAVLARWWGPAGSRNAFERFDLRTGGKWLFVMRSGDGTEYAMDKTFLEVVRPRRIVLQHHDPVHAFRMTMAFDPLGESHCRLTWVMRFDSAAEAERIREFVLAANEENFDRLEAVLDAAPGEGP